MILLPSVRLAPGEPESRLRPLAARALGVPVSALGEIRIVRKSLDARRKRDIHWQYALACACEQEAKVLARGFSAWTPPQYAIPKARSDTRPVVVGFGPAGIFAALLLAEAGLRPVVLERGAPVEQRSAAVQRFWEGEELSPEANVQFGEGGAGAFSDGKLSTGTHDGRIPFVLSQLRRFGAPEQIEYDAKPHVGTDVLRRVVRNLREHIRSLGGEICFQSRFIGFDTDAAGRVCAVRAETPEGPVTLPCRDLLLAPGHSARDTFELLRDLGLPMERKAFAMGVRIEHRQADINAAQYGPFAHNLPPADYKLSVRLPDGRGIFTFCMCPGGYVVASSSERGGVVTNGMSYSGRAGENANAALLVSIRPADFPEAGGVLAGMEWQRAIERQCFRCGGGELSRPGADRGGLSGRRARCGPRRRGVAQLSPRRALDGPAGRAAAAADGCAGPGPPPAGTEAPGLRRPRRGAHRPGDPLLLPRPHPAGRRAPVPGRPRALSLRGGGRLRRRHHLRRRGRAALRGADFGAVPGIGLWVQL